MNKYELYKNIYMLTSNEKKLLYTSVQEDNAALKNKSKFLKYIEETQMKYDEAQILLSKKDSKTVNDLIKKYSNNNHRITYNKNYNILEIKGSMYVPVFHSLILEARQFNFDDIILKS